MHNIYFRNIEKKHQCHRASTNWENSKNELSRESLWTHCYGILNKAVGKYGKISYRPREYFNLLSQQVVLTVNSLLYAALAFTFLFWEFGSPRYMYSVMNPPEEFPFPFAPYPIQENFMRNLYTCLESGNLGIFESPTGTGKSLSIICGALKWLVDRESYQKELLVSQVAQLDSQIKEVAEKKAGDWFIEQTEQIALNSEKRTFQAKLEAIEKRTERRNKLKEKVKQADDSRQKQRFKSKSAKNRDNKTSNDLPDEDSPSEKDKLDEELLLDDLHLDSEDSDEETAQNEPAKYTQIFFCSRTHSQLSQFVGELKKTPYSEEVSLVPIASRQNYCINKEVKRLKHVNLINERCLQLQKKKKTTSKKEKDLKRAKTSTSCPFMPGNQSLMIAEIVTKIQDVEEVANRGMEHETCGYYASRKSLQDGQVVLVPYNSILHKNTRVSSGIDLRGNVLIVDEAHNLLEAIERMHSSTITGRNILHCFSQLTQYQKRFESLFSAKNVLHLSQLSFCLKKLMKVVGGTARSHATDKGPGETESKVYKIENFEIFAEIDTLNVFELLEFIKNSKLIHKLQGYVEKYSGDLKIRPVSVAKTGVSAFLNVIQGKDIQTQETLEDKENFEEETSNNPLMAIVNFLECLKNSSGDGRIFVIPGATIGQGTLKFLLMNPAAHFHDIVKDARSVILAGGTMEPISEFVDQLFISAGAEPERIVTFSCDHVIPKENILTRIVTRGPTGVSFEFNYQNRQNPELLNELGRTLQNLCNVVPGGMVIFLPSYGYEEAVYKHLDTTGVIVKIRGKKQVYREPKLASQVNLVLENFAKDVKSPKSPQNGALLFSVVGGKLSEGLNFSDDLGRCVVVVGMPYPNIKSPELQEKLKYLNENVKPGAGNAYYENSCMKSVNQCIGRAVRHINDYSTVVLLDKRYANKTKSLPGWIQRTLMVNDTFRTTISDVAKFFAARRRKAAETA